MNMWLILFCLGRVYDEYVILILFCLGRVYDEYVVNSILSRKGL